MFIKRLLTLLCSCTLAISACGPVPDLARTVVNEADRAAPAAPAAPACISVNELQTALDQQYDAGFAAGVASVNCTKPKRGRP